MLKKMSVTEKKETFSDLWGPLVSKTINSYANATSSCLYISPARLRQKTPLNVPSRIITFQGFCWKRGYRNPLASVSYKKTYQKFLEALHLCVFVRQRGGKIHVIFDGGETHKVIPFNSTKNFGSSSCAAGYSKEKKTTESILRKPDSLEHKGKRLKIAGLNYKGQLQPNQFNDLFKNVNKKTPISQITKNYHLKNKKNFGTFYSWSGDKWVGGTFSNFQQISKSVELYKTISRQFLEILENQLSSRYFGMAKKFHGNIKKNPGEFLLQNHKGSLKKPQQGGLREKNLPDLVIIENAEKYKNVIAEAQILKIPVIAFVESDIFSNISIALPLNSQKHYFLAFLLQTIYKIPST